MKYGLYTMKDEKVGYLQVTQDVNDYTAIRNFTHAITAEGSLFNANKSDFKLYKLGEFDSATGEIVLCSTIELICDGGSL